MEDSSLRSGSESMLEQNISSYSSTISMDSLHSSPAVSRHSFPLEETLQEEARALPLRVTMPICDEQLQITPNQKPRKSVLFTFDPFYLSTPNRVLEAKPLGGLEDLVKEQPVLLETQPHDVSRNSQTEEQSFNAVDSVKTMADKIALQEMQKISEENDFAKRLLATLELAVSDVRQKYERSKKIIAEYKRNENALRERLDSLEDTVIKSAAKYETLEAHAKAQIEKSNQEMQAKRDEYETEIHTLSSMIKHLEIKNASVTESLAALYDEISGKRV